MLRAAAVAGLVALVAPGARAEFGCYEWPSLSDPAATVAYLVATDCEADLAALSSADGFSHLQQFGNEDYSESTCTNSAGMINFAELCNATKASLVSPLPIPALSAAPAWSHLCHCLNSCSKRTDVSPLFSKTLRKIRAYSAHAVRFEGG